MRKAVRWTARALGILSILFLSVFALDVFQPGQPLLPELLGFLVHLIPSFVLAVFLAVAWEHELLGGVLFAAAALGAFFLLGNPWFVNAILCGPFFIAGLLFIASHYLAARGAAGE